MDVESARPRGSNCYKTELESEETFRGTCMPSPQGAEACCRVIKDALAFNTFSRRGD